VYSGKAALALRELYDCACYTDALSFGFRMVREVRRMEWEIARLKAGNS
jgi:hypothetical protein